MRARDGRCRLNRRTSVPIPVSKDNPIRGSGASTDLANWIDGAIAALDECQKLDLRLRLAAKLCEDGAFDAAGFWPADKIAAAVVLAAQIERLVQPESS